MREPATMRMPGHGNRTADGRLLALKVDVDTFRGTAEGVPRLLSAFQQRDIQATFLFSLGPDHTGRAIRRAFRKGFMKKVARTSVIEHYGIRTLLNGTLLPGPDIGRRLSDILRGVDTAGFETGIHCWDHVKWQDHVAQADETWTRQEFSRALRRYEALFGHAPATHGAAGWQMNAHAYRLEEEAGFQYASDTRGSHPFWPVVNGRVLRCVQLPTTLPTLDELIGTAGITADNAHAALLRLCETAPAQGHVFTLHAELEGMKLMPVFERLLDGWTAQGYRLVSLAGLYGSLDPERLPCHVATVGEVAGRGGQLSVQGAYAVP